MAHDNGHYFMTRAAFKCLPEWEKKLWRSEEKDLEKIYSMDDFQHEKKSFPYLKMPNGKTPFVPWELRVLNVPEPGKGNDYFICGYYEHALYVFRHYVSRISKTIRRGKHQHAVRFSGIIAHFIEDAGCPPHSLGVNWGIDMEIVKLLFPSGEQKKRMAPMHQALEKEYVPFSLKNYSPQLMGTSPEESAFNLLDRFTDMLENSIKQILPMAKGFYRDNHGAIRKHMLESAVFSAKVLADTLHTSFCIAFQKFEKTERIETIHLEERTVMQWTGWTPPPYHYQTVRNSNMSINGKFEPVPLKLRTKNGIVRFEKGFGIGVPFEITYQLPKGTYKKFSSSFGLHPELQKKGSAVFKILLDGRMKFSKTSKTSEIHKIEIPLGQAEKITLVTEPSAAGKNTSVSHAVWAKPVLIK